jgi:hypothetical protein
VRPRSTRRFFRCVPKRSRSEARCSYQRTLPRWTGPYAAGEDCAAVSRERPVLPEAKRLRSGTSPRPAEISASRSVPAECRRALHQLARAAGARCRPRGPAGRRACRA